MASTATVTRGISEPFSCIPLTTTGHEAVLQMVILGTMDRDAAAGASRRHVPPCNGLARRPESALAHTRVLTTPWPVSPLLPGTERPRLRHRTPADLEGRLGARVVRCAGPCARIPHVLALCLTETGATAAAPPPRVPARGRVSVVEGGWENVGIGPSCLGDCKLLIVQIM